MCVSLPLEPSAASGVGHEVGAGADEAISVTEVMLIWSVSAVAERRTAVGSDGPPPLLTVSKPPGDSASWARGVGQRFGSEVRDGGGADPSALGAEVVDVADERAAALAGDLGEVEPPVVTASVKLTPGCAFEP